MEDAIMLAFFAGLFYRQGPTTELIPCSTLCYRGVPYQRQK
tara:strand:+ start:283 stop:405 length:123 start_codon:yes stop_codon:yes gene_type:complete